MIPLKEQEAIGQKLAMEMAGPVKVDYFTERNLGLTLPGKAPCQYCKPTHDMLREIAGLHDFISLRVHYFEDNPPEKAQFGIERVPAIVIRGAGPEHVKYYGMPGGNEFTVFLEAIVDMSRREVLLSQESVQELARLEKDVSVKVFVTPTCQYCPGMVRAVFQMAMVNSHIKAEAIEVTEFPELAERYRVQAVPLTVIDDKLATPGAIQEKDLVAQIAKAAGGAPAEDAGDRPTQSRKKIERGKTRDSGLYIP